MLLRLADLVVYRWAGLDPETRLGEAAHFFVHDSLKIFLLLAVMIFVIGVIRTWLPEKKLKDWMNRGGLWGNLLAALFGAITPFCSCSGIPVFIGLLKAGLPLGIAFSFLIASPVINEYLVVLMASEFGIPVTVAYTASGLLIGTFAGGLLGRMNLEKHLETDFVAGGDGETDAPVYTLAGRLRYGYEESRDMIRQLWVWLLAGIALGAFIHSYVPQDAIQGLISSTGFFAVPIAALVGVPLYANCVAIVPVAVVLFEKGISLGTTLAFMMAMAALSLPEAVMLRRTMKLPLIALYFGITAAAIVFTGYLLNALAPFLI